MSTSFIQISDCHIDDEKMVMDVDTVDNLESILNHLKSQTFDVLLVSGDLTHNGTLSAYKKLQEQLKIVDVNIHVMPGNHDDKCNLSNAFETEMQNVIQLGDWQIITLDSVQANKVSGFLTEDQLLFLEQAISETHAKYSVVCLHHPIVPMRSDWDDALSLENPEDLFSIIDKFPTVKAVLWGHAHQSEVFDYNHIKLYSCPSTALQFNGPDSIGYNHYTLHSDGQIACETHWL